MATWMVHLRVADKLLDQIEGLSSTEFVVGNIAPDSGVPNEDWSVFTPSGDISHFKTTCSDGAKDIHLQEYVDQFFTAEHRKQYSNEQNSFYLGYLVHLITDMIWAERIYRPSKVKFQDLFERDRTDWIWTLKKDWYDLDFLYIKKNPEFRSFLVYRDAVGFRNTYMEFFDEDAFNNRREYITGFYSEKKEDLDRVYNYLSEEEMDHFVEECGEEICKIIYNINADAELKSKEIYKNRR